ncbi:MAG: hypothetical protein U9R25_11435 [Chloroflexota bacterium]|nr:hypothetical protein [Chloroflexota bacterium]
MRFLFLILAPAVVLLFVASVLVGLPLPAPFPDAGSQDRNLLAAVAVGVLGIAYLVWLTVYAVVSFRQAGQALDPALTSRGLTAQSHLGFGRKYHGRIRDRQVAMSYFPARGLRRALLDMAATASIQGRAAIGERRPLLDCANCPPVPIEGGDMGELQVFSEDPAWIQRFLAEQEHRQEILRLLGDQQGAGFRELYLQPGRIWLRGHPTPQVTASQVTQWLDDLLALAELLERQSGRN